MTDFASLIQKAIERDLRGRFLAFLGAHRLVEFGRSRALTLDEIAMVVGCLDRFHVDGRFLDLGVAEIKDLRSRLSRLAHPGQKCIAKNAVANACFDALACIAALEARLCRCLDRAQVIGVQNSASSSFAANDNDQS